MNNTWNRMTGIKANRIFEYEFDGNGQQTPENYRKWKEVRNSGIGGSEISAIAGVNPWKSAIDVYLEKTGRKTVKMNDKMKWGKLLEDPVAREYANEMGVTVKRVKAILQHPEHKHFLVNLDRMVSGNNMPIKNMGNGCLEVKTTGWAQAWTGEEIPDMYQCQLQWECFVSGLKWGQFATLISGQDLIIPDPILKDDKFCDNLALIGDRFWHDHILKDVPPDVDRSPACRDALKILYPNAEDRVIMLDEKFEKLCETRMKFQAAIKTAEAEKIAIDSIIMRKMENAKFGKTDNFKITRVFKNSLKLNKKQIKENYPEIFKKCSYASSTVYPLYKKLKK